MSVLIKLYALSTCSHCRCTKDFLEKRGVKYECTDVDKLPADQVSSIFEEIKKLSSRCSFPTLVIGDKVIVGHRTDQIEEALEP